MTEHPLQLEYQPPTRNRFFRRLDLFHVFVWGLNILGWLLSAFVFLLAAAFGSSEADEPALLLLTAFGAIHLAVSAWPLLQIVRYPQHCPGGFGVKFFFACLMGWLPPLACAIAIFVT